MAKLTKAVKSAIKTAAGKVDKTAPKTEATETAPPDPSAATKAILTGALLRAGKQFVRRSVESGVLGRVSGAEKVAKGRSMTRSLLGKAVARIATRSVPGAIIVGGGLLAKTLYDRRRAAEAAKEGKEAVDKQADKA